MAVKTPTGPQHRAQRRHVRRGAQDRAREALAAGDLAPPAAARRCTSPRAPDGFAAASDGSFRVIAVPRRPLRRTSPTTWRRPGITAGLLSIEGAHALDGDPANVDVVADAGIRMISPAHFFDTAFGGSAHGIEQARPHGRRAARWSGGWRPAACSSTSPTAPPAPSTTRSRSSTRPGGRLAHGRARRARQRPQPLRTRTSTGSRPPAASSASGSGRRPAAGTTRRRSPARSPTRWSASGPTHVALGSDWDGAVAVPFDAANTVRLTDALLERGPRRGRDPRGHGRERAAGPRGDAAGA